MLSKTAILHKWDNTMMEQVQSLMTCDYMSSEESGTEGGQPVFFRKKLLWLKKKYRKAFRKIDNVTQAGKLN